MAACWLLTAAPTLTPTGSPPPLMDGGGPNTPSVVWGILAFLALMVLCWFGLRFLSKRNLLSARGQHMQVVDRMVVSKDCMILLVRVPGRLLAVGVTKDGMHTLCEVDPQAAALEPEERRAFGTKRAQAPPAPPSAPAGAAPGKPALKGFWGRFVHNLGVNSGLLSKDTPLARPEAQGPVNASFQSYLDRSQGQTEAARSETPPVPDTAEAPPHSAPVQATAANAGPVPPVAPPPGPRISYDEAINRMKQFGRLEQPEPRAADNLAFLQAARAYASQQSRQAPATDAPTHDTQTPDAPRPNAQIPAAPTPAAPMPAAPVTAPPQEEKIDLLLDRIHRRTRQLAGKTVQEEGKVSG